MMPWNKIGGAWVDMAKGSINIKMNDGARFVLFKNDYKSNDKHPDYNVCQYEDEEHNRGGKDNGNDIPF
jgi:hypothetical protein